MEEKNFEHLLEELLGAVRRYLEHDTFEVYMQAYLFNCQIKKEKSKDAKITTQEIVFDQEKLMTRYKRFLEVLEGSDKRMEEYNIKSEENPEMYKRLQKQKILIKEMNTILNRITALE